MIRRLLKVTLSILLSFFGFFSMIFPIAAQDSLEEMEEISENNFSAFENMSDLWQEEKDIIRNPGPYEIPALRSLEPQSAIQIQGTRPNRHALLSTIQALQTSPDPLQEKQIQDLQAQLKNLEIRPLYRLYNPHNGEHFYTPELQEKNTLVSWGWKDEGVDWSEMVNDHSLPVYRLYNPNAGDHHYTMDTKERAALIKMGWIDENIAWYADSTKAVPVYRAYNLNALSGAHHYTTHLEEYIALVESGWIGEGIGFYAPFLYSFCEEEVNGKKGIVAYDENDKKLLGSQKLGDDFYYFDPETGFMLQNEFFKAPDAQDYRAYGSKGKALVGKVVIDGKIKGFSSKTGYILRNCNYAFLDGTAYRFDEEGNVKIGSFEAGNAKFMTDSTGSINVVELQGLTFYMQTDLRWGPVMFYDFSFAGLGCVPTTMTTIINTLGKTNKNPLQIGRQLEAKGYLSGNAALSPYIKPLGTVQDAIPWLATQYGLRCRDLDTEEEMAAFLKAGGLIAISMGAGIFTNGDFSHEVLVFGYNQGKVNVHDPLEARHSGVYSLSTIFAQRNQDHYGIASNGPIFAFYNPDTCFEIEF